MNSIQEILTEIRVGTPLPPCILNSGHEFNTVVPSSPLLRAQSNFDAPSFGYDRIKSRVIVIGVKDSARLFLEVPHSRASNVKLKGHRFASLFLSDVQCQIERVPVRFGGILFA